MRPPALPRQLLGLLLPAGHRVIVLAHLDEEFTRVQRERAPQAAAWWYRRQVLASIPGALQMRARSTGLSYIAGDFGQDTRCALRQMRRAPGFSASAVLMLRQPRQANRRVDGGDFYGQALAAHVRQRGYG